MRLLFLKRWSCNGQKECRMKHVNSLIGRIYPIRQLAKYMIRLGIEAYVIPPGIPGSGSDMFLISLRIRNCKPFLLKLIDVRLICPVLPGISSFPSFFGCCTAADYALPEARLLKVEDVDLETGKLTIRQSKGNKDRNVMMSGEALDLCRIYHTNVSRIVPDRVGFFPNRCGKRYENQQD